jgi:hypothetical protein
LPRAALHFLGLIRKAPGARHIDERLLRFQ